MMYLTLAAYISFAILVLAIISTIALFIAEVSGVVSAYRARLSLVKIYAVLMGGMVVLYGSVVLLEVMKGVC